MTVLEKMRRLIGSSGPYRVAHQAGVDLPFLTKILAGEKKLSLETAAKIAPVLGLDHDVIVLELISERTGIPLGRMAAAAMRSDELSPEEKANAVKVADDASRVKIKAAVGDPPPIPESRARRSLGGPPGILCGQLPSMAAPDSRSMRRGTRHRGGIQPWALSTPG